jgi:hypothetical protein
LKRCEVLRHFHLKATDTHHVPGDIIEVSDAQLTKIEALGRNMVKVLAEVDVAEKPKKSRKTKQ